MKKRTGWVLLLGVFFALVCGVLLFLSPPRAYQIVGDYAEAERIESDFAGDGETDAYRVGLNETGMPAFLNPGAALKRAIQDYPEAFQLIARQNHLFPPGYFTRDAYKTYGWQTVTEDMELQQDCVRVSRFFDIYENSYPPVEYGS